MDNKQVCFYFGNIKQGTLFTIHFTILQNRKSVNGFCVIVRTSPVGVGNRHYRKSWPSFSTSQFCRLELFIRHLCTEGYFCTYIILPFLNDHSLVSWSWCNFRWRRVYSSIVSWYRNFCLFEKQPLPGWDSTSTVLFVKTCLPWEKTVQVAAAWDGVKVGSDDLPSAFHAKCSVQNGA